MSDAGLSAPDTAPAGAAEEFAGQAAFNPFGTIGIVAVQASAPPASAPLASQPVEADWALPVTTALVGFALIGWILRGMVQ